MTEKVFVVGFHKTGTSSLTKALEILGYKVAGPNPELLALFETRNMEMILKVVEQYELFKMIPGFCCMKRFMRNSRKVNLF